MDIIDALVGHHQEIRQLYRASESDAGRFAEFIRHLVVHHTMEEKYFYDLLQKVPDARHDTVLRHSQGASPGGDPNSL